MRPPSRAGNGSILTTQRLMERRAIITRIIEIGTLFSTIETNVEPRPIGHESISFASCRSVSVLGEMSPTSIRPRKSNVIRVVAIVSFHPMTIASGKLYLSSILLLIFRFLYPTTIPTFPDSGVIRIFFSHPLDSKTISNGSFFRMISITSCELLGVVPAIDTIISHEKAPARLAILPESGEIWIPLCVKNPLLRASLVEGRSCD